jgi:hypothetical protein
MPTPPAPQPTGPDHWHVLYVQAYGAPREHWHVDIDQQTREQAEQRARDILADPLRELPADGWSDDDQADHAEALLDAIWITGCATPCAWRTARPAGNVTLVSTEPASPADLALMTLDADQLAALADALDGDTHGTAPIRRAYGTAPRSGLQR